MDYTKIYNEELITLVKEKLKSISEVKTVKFVREQTGMSLIQAKKFVDACKE
jgi:ribosomal protein L7/L12